MNLVQNNIDNLNLEITLEISSADYAEPMRKKLAECKRKAEFKGFRKGMVPASLIKRVYGEQCLVEAVNQLVSEGLAKHIEDNSLKLLGEPIASMNQPEVVWEDGKDFTFVFDAAISPEVNFEVVKDDTVPSYTITASAKDKTSMAESIKKFYEEKKEEKSEEEIEKEAAERLKDQYANEAAWRLNKDIRDYFVAKAGITLPEEFLKRWLIIANEGKVTEEDVEKEFAGFAEDFKWQLIRGFLMRKYEFKIEQKDLHDAAEGYVRYQYAMYGLSNVPEEILSESVVNMLQNQKQVERLIEQVEDDKILARLKEEITLKATKISSTKFREL